MKNGLLTCYTSTVRDRRGRVIGDGLVTALACRVKARRDMWMFREGDTTTIFPQSSTVKHEIPVSKAASQPEVRNV